MIAGPQWNRMASWVGLGCATFDQEPSVGPSSDSSFEEFFAATHGRLVGLLFAVLHDRAQAEDVVQDAFASALLRWRSIRGYQDPEAWVRMVAFRRAVDARRRDMRRMRALDKLPLAHREVLVLRYVAELPVAQIAAELRRPDSRSRRHRLWRWFGGAAAASSATPL
jgi:RNA polymerase sigma-70 factor (ECF subfamily)